MSGTDYPYPQRPTQFDPHERRRRPTDNALRPGVEVYADYLLAIARSAADESARIPKNYVFLAALFQVIAIGLTFAPWGQYQTENRRVVQIRGIDSNGAMVMFFGIIALLAFSLVLVLNDKALVATIGFGAASACVLIGGWNWLRFDGWAVHDAMAVAATNVAAWGVVAETFASLLAAICGYFVMRVARLY